MDLHRIVPNLNVDDATTGHDFYEEFLGLGEDHSTWRRRRLPGHRRTRACRSASSRGGGRLRARAVVAHGGGGRRRRRLRVGATPRLRDRPPAHPRAVGRAPVLRPRPARRRRQRGRARGLTAGGGGRAIPLQPDDDGHAEQVFSAFTDVGERRLEVWRKTLDPEKYEVRERGERLGRGPRGQRGRAHLGAPALRVAAAGTIRWTLLDSDHCAAGRGEVRITRAGRGKPGRRRDRSPASARPQGPGDPARGSGSSVRSSSRRMWRSALDALAGPSP